MLAKIGSDIAWSLLGQPICAAVQLRLAQQEISPANSKEQCHGGQNHEIHQKQHYLGNRPANWKCQDHPGYENPSHPRRLRQSGKSNNDGKDSDDYPREAVAMAILLRGDKAKKDQPCGSELPERL